MISMDTPKVPTTIGIIIPVYNLEKYISTCLNSIFSQDANMDLFEVVIVDDGSSDNSLSTINSMAGSYSNIKVISQRNSGVSAARNRGIMACNSDFITFLDADDELYANSLSRIVSFLKTYGDTDVAYFNSFLKSSSGDLEIINDWDWKYKETKSYKKMDLLKHNSFLNGGCVWGCIYRRSYIIDNSLFFADGIVNNEDSIFNYRLLSKGPVIRFAKIPFYLVTERAGSASRSDSMERVRGYANNLLYALKLSKEANCSLDRQIADACIYNAISAATNMFLNIGEKDWRKLFDILNISFLHKLYIPWFPLNQKLKVLLINSSFRLYFAILLKSRTLNN